MSIAKNQVVAALSPPLPKEIVTRLLDDYLDIKRNFALGRFRPSELNGGRFAECVLRLIQHISNPPFTPFGTQLNTDRIIQLAEQNTRLHESQRFFIPRLARVLLDIRNRRDVAHVGGDVNPNYADSVFVAHSADWMLTEILRIYYNCSIGAATKIAESLNETRVPIIADVDGFLRVQNTTLKADAKVLVILHYKHPAKVSDAELIKWVKYSNSSRFKKEVLAGLDAQALIHSVNGFSQLLPKGIAYVEKNIPLDLLV